LLESLDGMTHDIAVDILRGKLAVDDLGEGLETVPQDPQDPALLRHQHTLAWQHAGLWRVGTDFFQPYARIVGFGPDDNDYAMREVLGSDRDCWTLAQFQELRARFYMQRRSEDRVVFQPDGTAVLFERRPDPAFWLKVSTEPDAALKAFLALRRLDQQGTMPKGADTSHDPRYWRFYEALLDATKLSDVDINEVSMRTSERTALAALVPLQDRIIEAGWSREAAQAGDDRDATNLAKEALFNANEAFKLAKLRVRIRQQAETCGGFLQLAVKDPYKGNYDLEVPAKPLLRWASRNWYGVASGLAPWAVICPQGMKMQCDNPMHTDWIVGAGLDPAMAYNMEHPVNQAAWQYAVALSKGNGEDFVRLAGKGKAVGRIVFPAPNAGVPDGCIAVVPNAGVDYEIAMLSACKSGRGAVIAAVGGKLAHLATVARETEGRVALVENAMTAFTEGELVELDFDEMTLTRLTFHD
jgi:hypothetical protein